MKYLRLTDSSGFSQLADDERVLLHGHAEEGERSGGSRHTKLLVRRDIVPGNTILNDQSSSHPSRTNHQLTPPTHLTTIGTPHNGFLSQSTHPLDR